MSCQNMNIVGYVHVDYELDYVFLFIY